jgi:molybdopterin-containing oxidoreductase family membrane subunit
MRIFKKPNPVLVACLVMTAMGIPGVLERIAFGQPATPQPIPWGLWIAAYTFFSGISAGSYTVAALAYAFDYRRFRPLVPFALLVSTVALITAVVFVLADLGHPERSFHIAMRPNVRSMMAWVIIMYNVFGIALISMLVAVLRPEWAKRAAETGGRIPKLLSLGYVHGSTEPYADSLLLKVMSIVGLACALGLGGGVGALFSVLGGRAFWHSGLFPITFMVSALLSGLSFVLGGASLMGRGGNAFKGTLLILGRLIGYLLAVELVILPAETLIVISGAIPSHINVLKAIGAGPYPWVFWGLQVGVGMFAALLLIFLPKRASLAAVSVASMCVLVGVFAFRLNFVIPQLAMGDFAVSDGHALYMPDLVEWSLVVFGFGLAGTLLFIGSKVLPVFSGNTPIDFELAARWVARPWSGLLRHQQEWR